jgi:hypothetical protein
VAYERGRLRESFKYSVLLKDKQNFIQRWLLQGDGRLQKWSLREFELGTKWMRTSWEDLNSFTMAAKETSTRSIYNSSLQSIYP